jgi:hypothetical protein
VITRVFFKVTRFGSVRSWLLVGDPIEIMISLFAWGGPSLGEIGNRFFSIKGSGTSLGDPQFVSLIILLEGSL